MTTTTHQRIAANLAVVRERITAAAERAGRAADSVKLVAVTKYVAPDAIRAVVAAGCTQLGESRPQQLWQRAAELSDLPIRWHMIGHMQRNKVRRTLPLVSMLQSVDSLRLAEAINAEAAEIGRTSGIDALLEVNVSGETAKHGFSADEVQAALPQLAKFAHLRIRGLMCMAGLEGNLDDARREFAALRQLGERLRGECPPNVAIDELSMGMSGDYEVAIAEGATIVRVGSALFEGIDR